ncbi:MAG: bifunctional riboflavin kinase/FAD synthetase [Melioribacteraceae bacterium]|nr:bifunctional riboflavin kinase/FAD synthetase [Melioribacteraceae bacterium]MCF8355847.1 bifunctional riboflavin kinase/FAD synthetase [Melioribacteraceae bacterium]MCF8392578.1 bifunctional riboflavin kinase/FAD synthetase [Melioribacteraceae bacterium]MCF8418550.1 bifunctional riboflavin kinase/FAD synthetase [Melioribacteraceae bacterium]
MNVYSDNLEIEKNDRTIVTIGTFDGVHVGHVNILRRMNEAAEKDNLRKFIVTFEPHPRTVLNSHSNEIHLLTVLDEKLELFENESQENVLLINFTKEFSNLSSEEFVKKYIVDKIGVSHIMIGYDHKFGKNRDGDFNTMKSLGEKFNFKVTSVDAVKIDGIAVSSTKIRNSINNGDVAGAVKYLGRYYSLVGKVVPGAERGRILGFPTANIEIDEEKLIPKTGVYVVGCVLGNEKHYGVMNIGYRPTFENSKHLVAEVHIFNFSRNIYDEILKIEFIKRIRDEKKFASADELIHQIENDKKEAKEYIGKIVN